MKFLRSFFSRRDPLRRDVAGMPIHPAWREYLGRSHQFIVSYPRSGNRWVRSMLADLMAPVGGEDLQRTYLRRFLPDIHQPPTAEQMDKDAQNGVLLLKSHNIRDLLTERMVYLFRHAPDALVSQFHFRCRFPQHQKIVEPLGLERFALALEESWRTHLTLALQVHERSPQNVLFVAYESLQSEPLANLTGIARFLGLDVTSDDLHRAISENSFEKSRVRQVDPVTGEEQFLLRKGKVGSGREELPLHTAEKIESATAELYRRAAEIAAAARVRG